MGAERQVTGSIGVVEPRWIAVKSISRVEPVSASLRGVECELIAAFDEIHRIGFEIMAVTPRRDQVAVHGFNPIFNAVAVRIKLCAVALNDADLKHKVTTAEIASHVLAINHPQASPRERIASIDEFARLYPEEAKQFNRLRANLDAQAVRIEEQQERASRQKELARRKSEGVRIGMSQEEVLQSSWGRPERVNRSVYSFGTHEQWVYGSGNYLYFEDGKLTSMQTGSSR